ncbi:MAG: hypothetical protein ACLPXB_18650 [Thiobacillaceae bacterium]
MREILVTLTAASLLAMAGCASQPSEKVTTGSTAATQVAMPALSAEAQADLAAAHAAVDEAKAQYALWTTAESAMKAAEEAATKGDSEGVIKNAKMAEDLANLGLEQAKLPPLALKNL